MEVQTSLTFSKSDLVNMIMAAARQAMPELGATGSSLQVCFQNGTGAKAEPLGEVSGDVNAAPQPQSLDLVAVVIAKRQIRNKD